MKAKMTRLVALIIALMLVVSLAACGGAAKKTEEPKAEEKPATEQKAEGEAKAEEPAFDTSKKLELVMYLMGTTHKDMDKVLAEANKTLEKDLNCTLKVNFVTWDNWQQRYNLLLTSGEKIDIIFASRWANFYKFSKEGAFLPLNDFLPKYMPLSYKDQPEMDWNDVTVGGKVFAIPCNFPEYTPDSLVYREDLRKKYGVPEINSIETIEAYYDAIKKNEPTMLPIDGLNTSECLDLFMYPYDLQPVGGDIQPRIFAKYETPRDMMGWAFNPDFVTHAKLMKKWADKGFWSKSALSSKKTTWETFKAGTGAACYHNPMGAKGIVEEVSRTHPEWEVGYFLYTRFNNRAIPNVAINNGLALPKSCSAPERSLLVIDKIRGDEKLFNLLTYGIEGYHWEMNENGKNINVPAKGQDPKENPGFEIAAWGWRNEKYMKWAAGGWDGYDKLNEEMKSMAFPNIFTPVYIDRTPIQSEYAAMVQVIQQYGWPIEVGLAGDVDAAMKVYQEKIKLAGYDKVLESFKQQFTAYLDEKGIK